jgi:(E)-4-hydroxy-3-methylbut-2-enyl-diphosphate synthase
MKASDVPMHRCGLPPACGLKCDFPFHLGVTEAGTLYAGIVKSALGIGMLLAEGIGDTLRVSLTRDPAEEVRVGFEILKSLGLRRQRGPRSLPAPPAGGPRSTSFRHRRADRTGVDGPTVPITGSL